MKNQNISLHILSFFVQIWLEKEHGIFSATPFKPPIKTTKTGSVCALGPDVTDEMLIDVENYGELYHRHNKNCTNIDTDGLCRLVKHTDTCLSDKSQMPRRNYRIHLKKMIKQNPGTKQSDILSMSMQNEYMHSIQENNYLS